MGGREAMEPRQGGAKCGGPVSLWSWRRRRASRARRSLSAPGEVICAQRAERAAEAVAGAVDRPGLGLAGEQCIQDAQHLGPHRGVGRQEAVMHLREGQLQRGARAWSRVPAARLSPRRDMTFARLALLCSEAADHLPTRTHSSSVSSSWPPCIRSRRASKAPCRSGSTGSAAGAAGWALSAPPVTAFKALEVRRAQAVSGSVELAEPAHPQLQRHLRGFSRQAPLQAASACAPAHLQEATGLQG